MVLIGGQAILCCLSFVCVEKVKLLMGSKDKFYTLNLIIIM